MFYFPVNNSAYTIKVLIYITITKPNEFVTIGFQFYFSLSILLLRFWIVVTSSIQFNDQRCTGTEKINDILINAFLSLKSNRIIF